MGKRIKEPVGAHDVQSASLSELIHQHVRIAIETAVREELRAALGTTPYERSDGRRGYRNGNKTRTLTGPTGPVPLTLPRATLFAGAKEWTSTVVPRYQRRMPEVNEAIVATYLAGGNARRIRGALQPLLKTAPLSKSAVSRVIATLKDGLDAWRKRSLADHGVVYLYLDGFSLRVRSAGKVVSVPVLGVAGVLADGHKHLLALELCGGESFAAWKGCLDDLIARGLRAPLLCITDGNAGLRRAVGEAWPQTAVQRCAVHKLRNLERKAPKHALAEIRDDFHSIVYATSADAARIACAGFERQAMPWRGEESEGRRRRAAHVLHLPARTVEDPTDHEHDREVARGISPAREDAGLVAQRRRRGCPALQPRRQRADQVAPDRRLAEDRRRAQPAYGSSGIIIIRVGLAVALALGVLAAPVDAQESRPPSPRKIPLVGLLHPGIPDVSVPAIIALRQGLRDLGYVDGQNIAFEYRWGGGKLEALPGLAAELVRLKVDVLYALGPQAIRAAVGASRTTAILGADLEGDPVADRFAVSLARPGGNLTGLFLDLPGLTGKWLQLLREVVPTTRRVAVLWDATTGSHQLQALRVAVQAAAMDLQVLEARRPAEYESVLKTAMRRQPHVLIQLSSPLILQSSRRVAEFTVANQLPAISMFREFPEAGGLMAYGPDLKAFFGRAASLVDKILKGAKPGGLPIEQPTKFELVINAKTAKALGLTIPPSLQLQANQVIQ